jgi:nucleotide-binding universal stress UspA family protein
MASFRQRERPIVQRPATASLAIPRVLVVIDGSERTGRVIDYAVSRTRDGRGADVILLGIVPEPPEGRLRGYGSFKRGEIQARLKHALERRAVADAGRRFDQAEVTHMDRIEVGDPVEIILRVVEEEGCDMVVLGDAPASGFRRWLPKVTGLTVATVASQVAQSASVPVVLIK